MNCPKCGANKWSKGMWYCGSIQLPECIAEHENCVANQRDQLAERVKQLETENAELKKGTK